jgi:hypothetical protein
VRAIMLSIEILMLAVDLGPISTKLVCLCQYFYDLFVFVAAV